MTQAIAGLHERLFGWMRHVDWLAPLALRLYLVPVFWVSGMNKASGFSNVVDWFGNDDWGLGLPLPWLMAFVATAAEAVGAWLLLLGLATRYVAAALIVTMLVAITTVHLDHGWQAVHDLQSPFASKWTLGIEADDAREATERLDRAKAILREHGNYGWITGKGNIIVSNSGAEWAGTYVVLLLPLLLLGAGRASLDHLLAKRLATPEP